MKSILEELFYGNVCPNTDCRSKGKETKGYNELTDINERELFVYDFCLCLSSWRSDCDRGSLP